MAKSVAERMMELFRGRSDAHGTHGVPEKEPDGLKWSIKRTAKTMRKPVTLDVWRQHLSGERPLGVIPIAEDNSCAWGSIDLDEYDVDLPKKIDEVERAKLPLVPCRSKSGGLHLFLFVSGRATAAEVQAALKDAAASLGMAECEIFPKQTQSLTDRGDVGNWMVMPYFGGDFGGKLKMQRGLKKTGAEMTIEEFLRYAEGRRTTIDAFARLCVVRRMPVAAKGKKGAGLKGKGDFSDGPPCLQHLTATGVQRDGRKRTLFMMALYYKRCDQSSWKERLEEANRKFNSPPLPAEEVLGVIKSCEKKDYEYTCKEEPMRSHCNSVLCRTRKFGVGAGGEFPTISGLTKLKTSPAIWFADVDDGRIRVELSTEELQTYIKFHRACMEFGKTYGMIRQDVWFSILAEAMKNIHETDAPEDIGIRGQFLELLEEHLTNRARGTKKEDLISDRPWEDEEEGKFYFTMRGLKRIVRQEGLDVDRKKMRALIEDLKGGHDQFNFGNKHSKNVWWVPSSVIGRAPSSGIPKPKGDEI